MFVILQKYDFSSKSQPIYNYISLTAGCLWYCKSTIFQANHNSRYALINFARMFVILQKYDFSSKSQRQVKKCYIRWRCLWYCKSTIFQANHNLRMYALPDKIDVCDTAKVRFFKQITTSTEKSRCYYWMFVILQKYDFSSKSQRPSSSLHGSIGCLWYCKSTIFQANHNC